MRRWLLSLGLLGLIGSAHGLPEARTSSGSDDDARIELRIFNRAIIDDPTTPCLILLESSGDEVEFRSGDDVTVRLYEADLSGDDLVWETQFEVSAGEVAAQWMSRTFDCTSPFVEDLDSEVEMYAKATIEKDACGLWCLHDRPASDTIDVLMVEDDDAEDDDALERAPVVGSGRLPDRVSRDADWLQLQIDEPSRVIATVGHDPTYGRVSVSLFRGAQELHEGELRDGDSRLETPPLQPGDYGVKLRPLSGDFNFYDLDLSVVPGGCVAGQLEQEDCGMCGRRERGCVDGEWGAWGACTNEGECNPGGSRQEACGWCGVRVERCDALCRWIPEGCEGEGECLAGASQQVACDGGIQAYTCGPECAWEIGPCLADDCTPGESRACYDGPLGTGGVGACIEGAQDCINGAWGACIGAVTPGVELCEGGLDEDCDGFTDAEDDDCDGLAEVGDPCASDEACGPDMECLTELPRGYCGGLDCEDCSMGAGCGEALGLRFCALRCGRNADCREGYHCAELVSGGLGCLPLCARDADCLDPSLPTCGLDGECAPFTPSEPDAFEPPEPQDAGGPLVDADLPPTPEVDAEPSEEGDASPFNPPPDAYRPPTPSRDVGPDEGLEVGQPVGCALSAAPRPLGLAPLALLLLVLTRRSRDD